MIELKNVSKIYRGDTYEIKALSSISAIINDGDFVAIMGKSGSGKSTLLNILGGMDSPTEGEYYIENEPAHTYNAIKLGRLRKDYISFVFQHFALMERYSVYENIELPLDARNVKRKERKLIINGIMKRLGIEYLADKLPGQISGGEQQRTAIARALAADTKYIFADEPTGALDIESTRSLMELFAELNEEGKTIIIVTHDELVAGYAKRIIYIDNGICADEE